MSKKNLQILVSAYACGPNWGSEIGMGWNWVISLSNFCQLHVITEVGFKDQIEKKLPSMDLKYTPIFYYEDIGDSGRKLFYKQGSFQFYKFYRRWQLKALEIARNICKQTEIDIIHQLNMIGYREPGFLWKIEGYPFIIGPVGGYEQFPSKFYSILDTKSRFFYTARNILNKVQMLFAQRPIRAYKKAEYVILATTSGKKYISKYTKNNPILISETGAQKVKYTKRKEQLDKMLRIIWVGNFTGRKALSIALKAVANTKNKHLISLTILGEGNDRKKYQKLAQTLNIPNINWYGSVENDRSKEMIASSDLLFFTSLLDATSTVIFEALQANTPVLCHDTCGFGDVIDDTCGIKIPVISPAESISQFSSKLDELVENPSLIKKLENGCEAKLFAYYWEVKGKQLFDIYQKCLN